MDNSTNLILKKLNELEERINRLEGKNTVNSQAEDKSQRSNTNTMEAVNVKTVKKNRSISEAKIAKEWFNKIGALAIIIGIVFFIGYSFQYLGPAGKIFIGYLISIVLVGIGLYLSRKYKTYANVMLAVGWAILYFTTFAAYYIEASKVIYDANFHLLLLFLVSGIMAVFAYYYDSEEFTVMAILLGAVSAFISESVFVSFTAIVIMSLYCVLLAVLKKWSKTIFASLVIAYATYALFSVSKGLYTDPGLFKIGSFFLMLYFGIFAAASLFINSGEFEKNKYITSLISINNIAFFILFISQLYKYQAEADGFFSAIFGMALLIIAAVSYYINKSQKTIYATYGWFGWGFLTLAIPLQLTGIWMAGAWLIEGISLCILGLTRNRKNFVLVGAITLGLFLIRFFSFDFYNKEVLSFGSTEIKSGLIYSLFSAAAFMVLSYVWHNKKNLDEEFDKSVFVPSLIANFILLCTILYYGKDNWIQLMLIAQGSVLYIFGSSFNIKYLRFIAFLPLVIFMLQLIDGRQVINENLYGNLNWRTVNLVVGSCMLFWLYAIAAINSKLDEFENKIKDTFAGAASLLLVLLVVLEVNSRLITIAWSVIGTLILISGFVFRKTLLRLCGIAILLLAILRIFIIDLSFLETIYRIISFIVLGGVLMGISFMYTKYKDKIL